MNSNVFQFKPKSATAEKDNAEVTPVEEMLKQSSAMTVLATLAFYANQGHDHGHKARAAMPAIAELLASKGIAVVPQ